MANWRGLLCGVGLLLAAPVSAVEVPPALEAWRGWALHGAESALCPVRDGREVAAQCRWPGRLVLEADAAALRFTQEWTLAAPGRVPLPGGARLRPSAVEVAGRPAAVVMDDAGRPWLSLPIGTHRVQGRIDWARRPASLPVPAEVALISLRIDGETLDRPQRNEDGELELGGVQVEEGDALQMETYRLLADGVPQWLATRVDLSVSGSPREQSFPSLLPEGFAPVALDSELPARLESDGRLRLQLRSGRWSLTLLARAMAPQERFRLPGDDAWPAQEIWQFRADPQFRVAQLTGLAGVDPNQVGLPGWIDDLAGELPASLLDLLEQTDTLPAYLFNADDEALLEVSLRGLPAQRPPRLSLQRALWLDFDGAAWRSSDRIVGELGGAARIDLRAPWTMQRAASGERGLLITEGREPGLSGVELRDAEVRVEVDARVPRDGLRQASGWTHGFDSATAQLNLPPAWRLIAATGVDRASGSWWEAWNLLDLFLLSVIALLAWRLGGIPLCALALGYGLLAWHEPQAPRVSVLVLIGMALLARHAGDGRLGRLARGLRALALLGAAVLAIAFAASGLRLALYPQLERDAMSPSGAPRGGDPYAYENNYPDAMEVSMAPTPQSPPMQKAQPKRFDNDNQTLDRIQVTGSRIKSVDLFAYPTDAIVQSGGARPNWSWQRYTLHWNGPLLADDALQLYLSPPWMTRLWRVAAVALLFLLLWRLGRPAVPAGRRPSATAAAAPAALGLSLLPLLLAMPVQAQPIPDAELLQELRARLTARSEPCRPNCGALGAANLIATPQRLRLVLDAHAQAELVWPLPRPDASLVLADARVDGAPAKVLRGSGGDWLHLPRGVHRVELDYLPEGERWRLAFPLAPARMRVDAQDFETVGVEQGRLVGDTLELIPPRRVAGAGAGPDAARAEVSEAVPPFVLVERRLILDQLWEQQVSVRRVAPLRGGINLRIPLLPGEQPFGNPPPVREGHAIVSLPAGVDEVSWTSRLTPGERFTLTAGDGREHAEHWQITLSPLLHMQASGIPEAGRDVEDGGVRRFLPLPGETLTVEVTRPSAIEGARFAIENVRLQVNPGQRARDSALSFDLRATQAGQHRIVLPEGAELLAFSLDGVDQPRVLEQSALRLPLRPGTQRVAVGWRESVESGVVMAGPQVALGGSASNLHLSLSPPEGRWLLLTRGPQVGPAVLIWGELLVMALVALLLARIGRTPLRFHHWLLLGLGFSTLSWPAAALVGAWLLLLGWRARRGDLATHWVFPWLQIGLVGLSALALLTLVIAVPYGLLGRPDMHVVGNGSGLHALNWFADRSEDGQLPMIQAISLPLWVYKLALLLWAMWLANALIGWLRWAWQCLGSGGWWRPVFRRRTGVATPADGATQGAPEA